MSDAERTIGYCPSCSKPLRDPSASYCDACGAQLVATREDPVVSGSIDLERGGSKGSPRKPVAVAGIVTVIAIAALLLVGPGVRKAADSGNPASAGGAKASPHDCAKAVAERMRSTAEQISKEYGTSAGLTLQTLGERDSTLTDENLCGGTGRPAVGNIPRGDSCLTSVGADEEQICLGVRVGSGPGSQTQFFGISTGSSGSYRRFCKADRPGCRNDGTW